MRTPIGAAFRTSSRLWVAAIVGMALVAVDVLVCTLDYKHEWLRMLLPPAGLGVYGILTGWDRGALGMRLRPVQGFAYWVKMTLFIGAAVGAFVVIAGIAAHLLSVKVRTCTVAPSEFWVVLFHMCVFAPLLEEMTYRFILCTPTCRILRPWGAVVLSGCAFAGLHFVYGRASPDNFIAGFFLAWAYLKSGSILVPIALHSLGNAVALSCQLASWYWLADRV